MSLPVEKRRQWIKSRRDQRKLTKSARLRRQLLRYSVLSVLLAIGGIAFTHIYWQLAQNKDKEGIEIVGNDVVTNNQIRYALKSQVNNTPLFLLNPTDLENKIKSLSAVKHAFVRRYALPYPRLRVEVLEEFPWATLYSAATARQDHSHSFGATVVPLPKSRLSSSSNASLSSLSTPFTPKSPTLSPQFVVAESGRLISIADFPRIYRPALKIYCNSAAQCRFDATTVEHWANWIAYISKEIQSPVLAIDMRESHDIKIETSKIELVLGNADNGLTRRLHRLASVLGVLANQHRDPTYVNLGLNSNIPVKLAKKLDRPGVEEKTSRL